MEKQTTTEIAPITGRAPGLDGLSGRVRVDVGGAPLATVTIDGPEVRVSPGGGEADAVLRLDNADDLGRILRAELNPMVAALQDRLEVEGDVAFAAKVLLGLQVPSDFSGQRLGKGA